jgi:hypothetical protein
MALTDTDPMPFGKYEGISMANIPASYLLFLRTQPRLNQDVRNYIDENLHVLNQENKFKNE